MNDRNESRSERSSKEIEKEELKAAGSLKEKAQIIWKNHKGEIAVGAVVVVGAVLILIR